MNNNEDNKESKYVEDSCGNVYFVPDMTVDVSEAHKTITQSVSATERETSIYSPMEQLIYLFETIVSELHGIGDIINTMNDMNTPEYMKGLDGNYEPVLSLSVSTPLNDETITVIGMESIKNKLQYVQQTYDQNLIMKKNPAISIGGFKFDFVASVGMELVTTINA